MIVYDETKRQANLAKHGLDLADTGLVTTRRTRSRSAHPARVNAD